MKFGRQISIGFVFGLATAAVSLFAQTNLVVNGGFETGNLAGWTVLDSYADIHATSDSRFVHSGGRGAWLGRGYPPTLSQTLATVPGQTYEINFWLKYVDDYWAGLGSPGTPNEFKVRWGVIQLLDVVNLPPIGWVN